MQPMETTRLAHHITLAYQRLHWRKAWRKVGPYFVGGGAILSVVLVRHFLINLFELAHISALVIALVMLAPEILARICDKPEFAAKVSVRRPLVIGSVLVITLGLAILLAFIHPPWRVETFTVTTAMRFLLTGALVGLFVRVLFVNYLNVVIRGISADLVQTWLLMFVAVYLFLFPLDKERFFAPVYLSGVALGFVVHFALRGQEQRVAREVRMGQNIEARLGGSKGPRLTLDEMAAVNYYKRQEWERLTALCKRESTIKTTQLAIIQASMELFRGRHEKARAIVEAELERSGPATELFPYLLLLQALCLGEIGNDMSKMFEVLELALHESQDCVLAKTTWALRIAEEVPLRTSYSEPQHRKLRRAHVQIRQAVHLAERDDPSLWGVTIGAAVPLTGTFLADANAYVVMRNGDMKQAKTAFDHCITVDPKFASPYVHLAEWYILLSLDPRTDEGMTEQYKKIARLCLNMAIELEDQRDRVIRGVQPEDRTDSLTKRRARMLLAEYCNHRLA